MKNILGLDIGPNSIGWSVINLDKDQKTGEILGIGSRIIPTDADLLSKFETGQSASKNFARRLARGSRRLRSRYKIRRQRLIDALKILEWIPKSFKIGDKFPTNEATLLEMKQEFNTSEISEDWVVYYLRHKALTREIQKDELARILYHMNQRRGFKSNRKVDISLSSEENEDGKRKREKKIEVVQIKEVQETGNITKGNKEYILKLSDGRIGSILRKIKPDLENQVIELEITTIPATKKDPSRLEFRMLNSTDKDLWAKQKASREMAISNSGYRFPGSYYFHQLMENKDFIIKDVSIDRKFYQEEIHEILQKQFSLNPTLLEEEKIFEIADLFYPKNLDKQKELKNKDLVHLFLHDIIYYQRPLKSNKSSIGECRLEFKNYRDRQTGKKIGLKAAPVSSPIFQEFRIWQTINNLRIIKKEDRDEKAHLILDVDKTSGIKSDDFFEKLFDLFDSHEKVNQNQILKLFGLKPSEFYINLWANNEEKELPGNETKALLRRYFKKASAVNEGEEILRDNSKYEQLWHLLYSVDTGIHIKNALQNKFSLSERIADQLSTTPPFPQNYTSFSQKAMKKLLPLMRTGKYWKWENIDKPTQGRLEKIFTGEFDESISDHTRNLFQKYNISGQENCKGFMTPMASYAVYGNHSERNIAYYENPEQVIPTESLNLRNPLVETVVNETLRLVRDVWRQFGRPYEIHIELARDLKKNAAERKRISEKITENENENRRISAILRELKWGNPNSLGDIERLKLWERQGDSQARESFKLLKFKRAWDPSRDEIEKYKLWASQNFLSPYSGDIIPISRLFTRDYDIDHIIPRSRLFDDSLENKVIVETRLNKEKGNRTALQYIRDQSKEGYKLLSVGEYENHINKNFYRRKKTLLLSADIPEGFINRQLVDTRYISKKLNELLAPVSENQKDPIISTTGSITNELKNAWGLGEKMKELVRWRFERLEQITGDKYIEYVEEKNEEGQPTGRKSLKLLGFEKRIDHRHHALDALIIACTTRSHIKYLNDLNAVQNRNENLLVNLNELLETNSKNQSLSRRFRKPWDGFVGDSLNALAGIVVSFKNNIRISGNKANKNIRFIQQPDGSFKKQLGPVVDAEGKKKTSPYVKLSLHKATIYGKIDLREYKDITLLEAFKNPSIIANREEKSSFLKFLKQTDGDPNKALKQYKIHNPEILGKERIKAITFNRYFANRVSLTSDFDVKKINKIPDAPLRAELLTHIENIHKLNDTVSADFKIEPFSGEGIEILNKGRKHRISKLTITEESNSKFEIRPGAFTEADKGTNLYYVVYENLNNPQDRIYESIPLRTIVEARQAGSGFIEEKSGYKWFTLSPNDLVYMPDDGENFTPPDLDSTAKINSKIYRFVSCTGNRSFFLPNSISKIIKDKVEFLSLNKSEKSLDGRIIKQFCIKLKVDRLGKVKIA